MMPGAPCGRPSDSGGRHVKGEHIKDAANETFQRYAAARGDPDATPPTTHPPRLPLGDT